MEEIFYVKVCQPLKCDSFIETHASSANTSLTLLLFYMMVACLLFTMVRVHISLHIRNLMACFTDNHTYDCKMYMYMSAFNLFVHL